MPASMTCLYRVGRAEDGHSSLATGGHRCGRINRRGDRDWHYWCRSGLLSLIYARLSKTHVQTSRHRLGLAMCDCSILGTPTSRLTPTANPAIDRNPASTLTRASLATRLPTKLFWWSWRSGMCRPRLSIRRRDVEGEIEIVSTMLERSTPQWLLSPHLAARPFRKDFR